MTEYKVLLDDIICGDQTVVYQAFQMLGAMDANIRLQYASDLAKYFVVIAEERWDRNLDRGSINFFHFLNSEMKSLESADSPYEFKCKLGQLVVKYLRNFEHLPALTDLLCDAVIGISELCVDIEDEDVFESFVDSVIDGLYREPSSNACLRRIAKVCQIIRLEGLDQFYLNIFFVLQNLLEKDAKVLEALKNLLDIERCSVGTTLIDGEGSLEGFLNLAVKEMIWMELSLTDEHVLEFAEYYLALWWTPKMFNLKPISNVRAIFFKIFSIDAFAMYEVLQRLLCLAPETIDTFPEYLDPLGYYLAMIEGAGSVENFCTTHLKGNVDGLGFTLLCIKVFAKEPRALNRELIQFHGDLKAHLETLHESGDLGFSPAALIRNLSAMSL